MKILHIVWGLRYGGAETMLTDIVNRQCLEHEIELLVINQDIDQDLLSQINTRIKIHKINRPPKSKSIFYILKLNQYILFSNADIIHFHQENIIRYLPIYFLKRNLCLTVHDTLMDMAEVRRFKFIFAISEKVKEEVWHKAGETAILVPNGIDVQAFNKKKKFDCECFRIVQIGRLKHLHKGQHLTLKAIHRLVTHYNYTTVHLDIIGEGDSEKYLKELSDQLKINEYVTFLGAQTKNFIQKNLTNYDLLVQPSLHEGFGLTIAEAMSAMTATLISNVEGMKTISKNGELSYTFQSGDADDLAQKIISIIQSSDIDRKSLVSKAYDYVAAHFDISLTADNYLSNYERILANIKKGK